MKMFSFTAIDILSLQDMLSGLINTSRNGAIVLSSTTDKFNKYDVSEQSGFNVNAIDSIFKGARFFRLELVFQHKVTSAVGGGVPRLDGALGKKKIGASMLEPKVFWE